MNKGDNNTVPEKSSDVNLSENKQQQVIEPETALPVASGSGSISSDPDDPCSLEDVIKATLQKKIAENPLWSDELKQRMSKRFIELFDQETEKSKKEAALRPVNPDVEKKKAVDALLEEANKQLLATVECRKNIPPQCVEHFARMARLECTYYKQAGTGPGVKERLEAAKQKYRAENEEAIAKETERSKSLAKAIEEDTKQMMEVSRALEEKHSNLRKVIDIRATQRKSRRCSNSGKEEPATSATLPALEMSISAHDIDTAESSNLI